jgi:hypothetical protein
MTSESAVEFAPPESPLPAPRVTTGIEFSLAYFSAIEISAALCASKTANGAAADANGAWSREYEAVISGSDINDASGPKSLERAAKWLMSPLR